MYIHYLCIHGRTQFCFAKINSGRRCVARDVKFCHANISTSRNCETDAESIPKLRISGTTRHYPTDAKGFANFC